MSRASRRTGARDGRARVPADNWAGRHPAAAALLSAAGVLLFAVAALWISLPEVGDLAEGWPERTAYMRLRVEQAGSDGTPCRLSYHPVPLSRIPRSVQRAVLVSEDAAFYAHGGFDWHEVRAAVRRAWRERSVARGASTITQQLARNLYLSPRRELLRKAREALIAWKLERELPKRRILELYLNVIEFGPCTFGAEAASRRYFGVGVSELDLRRAAMLAATIPSPLRHNPATDTGRFRWRTGLIHRRAFGAPEEREELVPPPDSAAVEVEPPWLPDAAPPGLPAPDPSEEPPADSVEPPATDSIEPPAPDSIGGPPADIADTAAAATPRPPSGA